MCATTAAVMTDRTGTRSVFGYQKRIKLQDGFPGRRKFVTFISCLNKKSRVKTILNSRLFL